VICFRCFRAPDVIPYPTQGKTQFYFKCNRHKPYRPKDNFMLSLSSIAEKNYSDLREVMQQMGPA
jgi:hypothetical protein